MNGTKATPHFLITIDTEGDNLWSKPSTITTQNAKCLPRFQRLCESYGFKPTYLTNFEMAKCPEFQELGKDIIKNGTGEIGMHLHAWNSPPLIPLTLDDHKYHPYLVEYPEYVVREKVRYISRLLEDTFGVKMISHRAGRWGFNEVYARILAEEGYRVDCSVTPHVSWKRCLGDPNKSGGSDYSNFPNRPYRLSLDDIGKSGQSSLLEVPVTTLHEPNRTVRKIRACFQERSLLRRALDHFFPPLVWFRPNGTNLKSMLQILKQAKKEKHDYLQFILHSSELMSGGSPTFPRDKDIEMLYDDLERIFRAASETFKGATLTEHYHEFCRRHVSNEGVLS